MSSVVAFYPALVLAALGAILDLRYKRLPNWLCGALAVAAGTGLAFAEGVGLLPWALLHAAIALIIGMALFALGAIGGGDAKFYTAAALSIPANSLAAPMAMLGYTSVSGLVLLIIMIAWRRIRNPAGSRSLRKGAAVPYGVAIAAGLWLAILVQPALTDDPKMDFGRGDLLPDSMKTTPSPKNGAAGED